jgi:hypothetical protein
MITIRPLRKSDRKRFFSLATEFFRKDHWRDDDLRMLTPMMTYKDYEKHLLEDINGYMRLDPKKAPIFEPHDGD